MRKMRMERRVKMITLKKEFLFGFEYISIKDNYLKVESLIPVLTPSEKVLFKKLSSNKKTTIDEVFHILPYTIRNKIDSEVIDYLDSKEMKFHRWLERNSFSY